MAVFELKTEVPSAAVDDLENLLAELEEQRLMVLEDKPAARAWLVGYFDSSGEAHQRWKELTAATGVAWANVVPVVRELPDENWKDSYKAHFKAWKFGRLNWVPVWERGTFRAGAGEEV